MSADDQPPPDRLEAYRAKRSFDRTPEPGPELASSATGRSFVVQKHAARRLHYDFRLELDGVLLSWAVPKGPSLDPRERRLAVRTEDHPVEYGSFEGVIPKGEYGGGTVLLWDRGAWKPIGDPKKSLSNGQLKLELDGEKMRGRWNLVRTRRRQSASGDEWLLIKGRDAAADPEDGERLVRDRPLSVVSGRDLDAIAADPDRVWHGPDEDAPRAAPDPSSIDGAKRQRRLPQTMKPQLATLTDAAPEGDGWLHEIKHDGYRILTRVEGGDARLFTRRGNDWTARLPSLARVLSEMPVATAWLDGEIVVLGPNGTSDFGRLQRALEPGGEGDVRYFLFDLMHLDGWDLRASPLLARKAELRRLLRFGGALEGRLRYSDHVIGRGPAFFAQACELGAEGALAKRVDRPYVQKRSRDWRKLKCLGREDFVVGGWTDPRGSRRGIGALLVGERADGELRYRGKVGTGFDEATLKALRHRLEALAADASPFVDAPKMRGVHSVRPELVVEVAFRERTADGRLRHPSFQGVREDVSHAGAGPPRGARGRAKRARLTSPDRVLYPDLGLTKRELAKYWLDAAAYALPHLKGRPLALVRCPEGVGGECFFAKHAYEGMPEALEPVKVKEGRRGAAHTTISDEAGLVALAQVAALEVHVWGSRLPDIERPDQLVIDLDPGPGVSWKQVIDAALEVRALFEQLGLTSFVKLTGGKGLHVVIPVTPTTAWPEAKRFCQAVAQTLERRDRDRYTATITKSEREKKIFVDYLRNGRGATAVAPYSTRNEAGAPVAAPIRWDELDPKLPSNAFGLRDMSARLASLDADPWDGFFDLDQTIPKL